MDFFNRTWVMRNNKPVSCVYHWSSGISWSASEDNLRYETIDMRTGQRSLDMRNPTVTKRFNTGNDKKGGKEAAPEPRDAPVHMDGRISKAGHMDCVWQEQHSIATGRVAVMGERIAEA